MSKVTGRAAGGLALGVAFALILAACGGDAKMTSAPPTVVSPPGWARHASDKFEVSLPLHWFVLSFAPEQLDQIIEQLRPNNPTLVPVIEAARGNDTVKLYAFDSASEASSSVPFARNLNVIRSPGSGTIPKVLDQTSQDTLKRTLATAGITLITAEAFKSGGLDALKLRFGGIFTLPSGQSLPIEALQVHVVNGGDLYTLTLTYLPGELSKYQELFESVVQTLRVVK